MLFSIKKYSSEKTYIMLLIKVFLTKTLVNKSASSIINQKELDGRNFRR